VTQSAADVPTATENDSMLESLSDNFSGFVIHRQTSAESREWVAKLCGTRALWQSTDRTGGSGLFAEGSGSRRTVHEFIVRPDALKDLSVGQAYVWTPTGPEPSLVNVAMPPRIVERPSVDNEVVYAHAGVRALGEYRPPTPSGPPAGEAKARRGPEGEDQNEEPVPATDESEPATIFRNRQDPKF
jgi:hypothetical protein